MVQVCRFHIRMAWNIRRFVNEDAAIRIMLSTVMCRLDYCNSLLVNLPQKDIAKLQLIQNAAARLVSLTPKFESVKPVLKRLHWLPVAYRIKYKIAVMMHRCAHGTATLYLQSMLVPYVPRRTLRSSNNSAVTFEVPRVNQKTVGIRAFSTGDPRYGMKFRHLSGQLYRTMFSGKKLKTLV